MLPELKDCWLDHIAIAVNSIEKRICIYEDLGIHFDEKREIVEEQKVITAFASIGEKSHLELLESTDPLGPIGKFISSKGEGIHHLSFRVDDIRKKMDELILKGYRLIYSEPKTGANEMWVNFIHPSSTGGVLIEISEAKKR
jgi:methylmalonyl-CoA/ethylmalonyl-CoA epimerase